LSELAKTHADMRLEPVNLKLPRFRVRYEIEMSQVIQDIGAPTPFDSDLADFTGLTSTGEQYGPLLTPSTPSLRVWGLTATSPQPHPPRRVDDSLVVSAVYHQTYMNVDEMGTEAAAATAVVMGRGGGRPPPQPVRYVVNRPFVCVLYHPRQQCVLFVGRICDPSA
jgi:serpin B